MENLIQKQQNLLSKTDLTFKRYLFAKLPWEERMVGLVGPRGVGKTTMMLQYIKLQHRNDYLYVSADDIYFAEHRLIDVADNFYKNGGKHFFIDEIHKYKDWSIELKNLYDFYPDLKVCFTGSSILDIRKGLADLSRRAIIFHLQGFSFREYLNFEFKTEIPVHSFDQIIHNQLHILNHFEHPLPLFRNYLKTGYYPISKEDHLDLRLSQILNITLEVDIPQYANLSVTTARKLKKLMMLIAESVPFKPNFVSLAAKLEVSRNSLEDYLRLMEDAGLIARLRDSSERFVGLGKVEKVYLDNPNLIYLLAEKEPEIGNVRETFFFNQTRLNHSVISSKAADFKIDKYTFEIGGKNKSQAQIKNTPSSYLVKDNIEVGFHNVIPLWAFGLLY